MIHTITASNPDQALFYGLTYLKDHGYVAHSRNGAVLRAPGPVVTTFRLPHQRVIFDPVRDANPFFHLFEALWMLAGCNDVDSVARYAANMKNFSDDGEHLWGAYGFRWRHFFGVDQLTTIIDMLRADPTTRRAVLTMWSPVGDLVSCDSLVGGPTSKDVPCNTQVFFDVGQFGLDMTVCNRSNDAVWGAYGANVVHMSMLHEFVAAMAGLELGAYHQFSNNFHMYLGRPDCERLLKVNPDAPPASWRLELPTGGASAYGKVYAIPLADTDSGIDHRSWLEQCAAFVGDPLARLPLDAPYYLRAVAQPLMQAHAAYKAGDFSYAQAFAGRCAAPDWALACSEWLIRREEKSRG